MVEPLRCSQELAMGTELVALLIVGSLTAANVLVSTVAMALGGFAAASPHRARRFGDRDDYTTWLLNAGPRSLAGIACSGSFFF